MDPDRRKHLNDEWLANEAALERLADLPSGELDPAERERQLDREQDEIEYELGVGYLHRKLMPDASTDN